MVSRNRVNILFSRRDMHFGVTMGLVSQICPSKNYKLLTSPIVNSKMHILARKEDITTNPSGVLIA